MDGLLLAAVGIDLVASDSLLGESTFRLPLSFAINKPKSDTIERVAVVVEAIATSSTGAELPLFSRRAVTGLIEGKILVLPMYLSSLCRTLECPAGQTCSESGCVYDMIDENELQESTRDSKDLNIPVANAVDAGSAPADSGGHNDAELSPDAGITHADSGLFADAHTPMDAGFPFLDADTPMDAGFSFLDAGSLYSQTHPVEINWVYSTPASLFFNQNEVTVAQYEACITAGTCARTHTRSSTQPGAPADCNYGNANRRDHPINCVNWFGAVEFCDWIGARLPTEDEWYKEVSNNGRRDYPWGDTPQSSCTHAVIEEDAAGGKGCGMYSTGPVCSKPLGNSVNGACDLSGNGRQQSGAAQAFTFAVVPGAQILAINTYLTPLRGVATLMTAFMTKSDFVVYPTRHR